MAVVRELTKIHEEVFRGTTREGIEHFREPRGEFTIVINGGKKEATVVLTAEIENEIRVLQQQGVPARDGVARLSATTGLPRKELYHAWLETKHSE